MKNQWIKLFNIFLPKQFRANRTLQIKKLIDSLINRGAENIAAEIITMHGLENEYRDLILKVDHERSLLYM